MPAGWTPGSRWPCCWRRATGQPRGPCAAWPRSSASAAWRCCLDYRGYGGNPGRPSEDGLAKDAVAASDVLQELGFPPSRTIYLGESLGTGVVAALPTRRPPAGIVLRSPFTELADVGSHHYPYLPVRLLLRDTFPVLEHLAASEVPVTVIYGDRDSVVRSAQCAGGRRRRRAPRARRH